MINNNEFNRIFGNAIAKKLWLIGEITFGEMQKIIDKNNKSFL